MVLAATFILSGFVKAVDPLGTQYKISDYLEAANMGGLLPDRATLGVSVLLSAAEFCLGIFLLFAVQRRLTSRLILLIMAVMTPLFQSIIVVTSPMGENAPPEFAARTTRAA